MWKIFYEHHLTNLAWLSFVILEGLPFQETDRACPIQTVCKTEFRKYYRSLIGVLVIAEIFVNLLRVKSFLFSEMLSSYVFRKIMKVGFAGSWEISKGEELVPWLSCWKIYHTDFVLKRAFLRNSKFHRGLFFSNQNVNFRGSVQN